MNYGHTSTSPSTPAANQPIHRTLRPHSTPATLIWLEENYELAEGVCIPRSVLYMHYVDFSANNFFQPVNAASFGKIIRQQFPQLTTRRLGTRGQSRYHYYGIAIREASAYYQPCYSKKSGQNNVDPLKREARENINRQPVINTVMNSRSRASTMLPSFPNLKDIILPNNLDKNKISTFLMMYRTHCQRILDTIIRANFDEVQTFLLHFWQGVPPHLSPILECNSVVNLIGVCDSILYKTIANVLLPSILQALPESVTKIMRQFATELETWLKMSLFNLPDSLRTVKLEMARRFEQVIKRQTSLNHLSQASRMVVNNNDITLQMLRDWRVIDMQSICREILYDNDYYGSDRVCDASGDSDSRNISITALEMIKNFCQQFERLLEDEAQIENYLEWLESMVQTCVLFPSIKTRATVKQLSRQFLLLWSAFCSRVIRDMTLHSAPSFGSFHLLRLMFDDYVLYLLEYVQIDEQMKQFITLIPNNEPPIFTVPYFNECGDMFASDTDDIVGNSGDFVDNQNQIIGCNDTNLRPLNQDSYMNGAHHGYAYQTNYQYQCATYNQPMNEQNRANSWYTSLTINSYDYDTPQNGSQIIASMDEQLNEISPISYPVDSISIEYNNDYERQV